LAQLIDPSLHGLIKSLPDREWRTLSVVLTQAAPGDCLTVDLAAMACELGEDRRMAMERLNALEELRWGGHPLLELRSHDPLVYRVGTLSSSPRPPADLKDLSPVFQYAESVLARPLGNAEILAIRRWNEEYGFDYQVICALLEECYRRGQKHLAYLDRVAANWHDKGVRDLSDVESLELAHRERTSLAARVARYLNLARKLTEAEQAMIAKWTEWGFSLEVILKACATTVNIDRPNFAYIDRVLGNWRAAGLESPESVEQHLAREQTRKGRRRKPATRAADSGPPSSGKDDSFYEQFEESAVKHRACGEQGTRARSTIGGKGQERG
jgi:DnaD/phage-associated family protein